MAPSAVGARRVCATCGTEIIVVKRTDEAIACCGEAMQPKEG